MYEEKEPLKVTNSEKIIEIIVLEKNGRVRFSLGACHF